LRRFKKRIISMRQQLQFFMTMKKIATLLAVLTAGLFVSCSTSPKQSGSVDLFNGKNLDNWDAFLVKPEVKKEEVWSVKDGLLVCKGEPLGYLFTKKSYTSFKLLVEWRWAPGTTPGNNGVLMRINGQPSGVPRCIEAQLKSGDAGDLYGFHDMKIDGDPARLVKVANHELVGNLVGVKKMVAAENPPGDWNTYEIIADGPTVKAWINGKLVNEAINCDIIPGPVAVQSEGGEIHFRTIRLTPIGG